MNIFHVKHKILEMQHKMMHEDKIKDSEKILLNRFLISIHKKSFATLFLGKFVC